MKKYISLTVLFLMITGFLLANEHLLELDVEPQQVAVGQDVEVAVKVIDLDIEDGYNGFQMQLNFNAENLRYVGYEVGELLDNTFGEFNFLTGHDNILSGGFFNDFGETPIDGTGSLVVFKFKAINFEGINEFSVNDFMFNIDDQSFPQDIEPDHSLLISNLNVYLEAEETDELVLGEVFQLTLAAQDLPENTGFIGFSFNLNFNPDKLLFHNYYPGSILEDDPFGLFDVPAAQPGKISGSFLNDMGDTEINGDGTLVTLEFKIIAAGEVNFTNPVLNFNYVDDNENEQQITLTTFSQLPEPFTTENITLQFEYQDEAVIGNTVAVDLLTQGIPQGTEFTGFNLQFDFDETRLIFDGFEPGEILTNPFGDFNIHASIPGRITGSLINDTGNTEIAGSGILATFYFKAAAFDEAVFENPHFSFQYVDPLGNENYIPVYDIQMPETGINIDNLDISLLYPEQATLGENIVVQIFANDIPDDSEFFGFELQFDFDGDKLLFESFAEGSLITNPFGEFGLHSTIPNRITGSLFNDSGDTPITGSGTLVEFHLKCMATGLAAFENADFLFNYVNSAGNEIEIPITDINIPEPMMIHNIDLAFSYPGNITIGQTVHLQLDAQNIPVGSDFTGFELQLDFDDTRLVYAGYETGELITNAFEDFDVHADIPNRITGSLINDSGDTEISGNGSLLILKFKAVVTGDAEFTNPHFSFTYIDQNDQEFIVPVYEIDLPEPLIIENIPIWFEYESVGPENVVVLDEHFEVFVKADVPEGTEFKGFSFELMFDESMMGFLDFNPGDLLSNVSGDYDFLSGTDNILTVELFNDAGSTEISGMGTLISFIFNPLQVGITEFTVSDFAFYYPHAADYIPVSIDVEQPEPLEIFWVDMTIIELEQQHPENAVVDQVFELQLLTTDIPEDYGFFSFNMVMDFDPEKVEYLYFEAGDMWQDNIFATMDPVADDEIRFSIANTDLSPISGEGVLLSFFFMPIATGTAGFEITAAEYSKDIGSEFEVVLEVLPENIAGPSSIDIKAVTIQPPTYSTIIAGMNIEQPINITAEEAEQLRVIMWADVLADYADADYDEKIFSVKLNQDAHQQIMLPGHDEVILANVAYDQNEANWEITLTPNFINALNIYHENWEPGDPTTWIFDPIDEDGYWFYGSSSGVFGQNVFNLTNRVYEIDYEYIQLTVDTFKPGNVEVNGAPYIDPVQLGAGSPVVLTAIPGEDYQFDYWTREDGAVEDLINWTLLEDDDGLWQAYFMMPAEPLAMTAHFIRIYSTYDFTYGEFPDFILPKSQHSIEIPVTFATDELGANPYEGVRFKFEAETADGGDVHFSATDSNGQTHTFINEGYWGPSDGFELPPDYDATTLWTLFFGSGGHYTVHFSLIDAETDEVIDDITDSSEIIRVYHPVTATPVEDFFRTIVNHEVRIDVDVEFPDDFSGLADEILIDTRMISDIPVEAGTELQIERNGLLLPFVYITAEDETEFYISQLMGLANPPQLNTFDSLAEVWTVVINNVQQPADYTFLVDTVFFRENTETTFDDEAQNELTLQYRDITVEPGTDEILFVGDPDEATPIVVNAEYAEEIRVIMWAGEVDHTADYEHKIFSVRLDRTPVQQIFVDPLIFPDLEDIALADVSYNENTSEWTITLTRAFATELNYYVPGWGPGEPTTWIFDPREDGTYWFEGSSSGQYGEFVFDYTGRVYHIDYEEYRNLNIAFFGNGSLDIEIDLYPDNIEVHEDTVLNLPLDAELNLEAVPFEDNVFVRYIRTWTDEDGVEHEERFYDGEDYNFALVADTNLSVFFIETGEPVVVIDLDDFMALLDSGFSYFRIDIELDLGNLVINGPLQFTGNGSIENGSFINPDNNGRNENTTIVTVIGGNLTFTDLHFEGEEAPAIGIMMVDTPNLVLNNCSFSYLDYGVYQESGSLLMEENQLINLHYGVYLEDGIAEINNTELENIDVAILLEDGHLTVLDSQFTGNDHALMNHGGIINITQPVFNDVNMAVAMQTGTMINGVTFDAVLISEHDYLDLYNEMTFINTGYYFLCYDINLGEVWNANILHAQIFTDLDLTFSHDPAFYDIFEPVELDVDLTYPDQLPLGLAEHNIDALIKVTPAINDGVVIFIDFLGQTSEYTYFSNDGGRRTRDEETYLWLSDIMGIDRPGMLQLLLIDDYTGVIEVNGINEPGIYTIDVEVVAGDNESNFVFEHDLDLLATAQVQFETDGEYLVTLEMFNHEVYPYEVRLEFEREFSGYDNEQTALSAVENALVFEHAYWQIETVEIYRVYTIHLYPINEDATVTLPAGSFFHNHYGVNYPNVEASYSISDHITFGFDPDWGDLVVYPENYRVIGEPQLDFMNRDDTDFDFVKVGQVIGAFKGGELRGMGVVELHLTDDGYENFVDFYVFRDTPSSQSGTMLPGEIFYFKLFDRIDGSEIDGLTVLGRKHNQQSIPVVSDIISGPYEGIPMAAGVIGSLANKTPLLFSDIHFYAEDYADVDNDFKQLVPGWNFISFPYWSLGETDNNLEFIFDPVRNNITQIKNQQNPQHPVYGNRVTWFPDNPYALNMQGIYPEYGYWVQVDEAVTLPANGVGIEYILNLQREVDCDGIDSLGLENRSLNPGWNLFGYPYATSFTLTELFAPLIDTDIQFSILSPMENKYYHSQYAETHPHFNTLHQLHPGYGYWVEVDQHFEFDYNAILNEDAVRSTIAGNLRRAKPQRNTREYQPFGDPVILPSQMLIFIEITVNEEPITSNSVIAAFADEELRGKAEIVFDRSGTYALLIVNTEIEEELNFQIWDSIREEYYDFNTTLISLPGETLGDPLTNDYFLLDVDILDTDAELPELITAVQKAYPNPFNPITNIAYSLESEKNVSIAIYNIRGQLVNTLVNEVQDAGLYNVIWDGKDSNGRNLGSGVYFYRFDAGDYSKVQKMMLLK